MNREVVFLKIIGKLWAKGAVSAPGMGIRQAGVGCQSIRGLNPPNPPLQHLSTVGLAPVLFSRYCYCTITRQPVTRSRGLYGAGLATARSWIRIPPAAAVYQRQLIVPSLRGRLTSTSESRGVNGHTTRCTIPVSAVSRLRLVSG